MFWFSWGLILCAHLHLYALLYILPYPVSIDAAVELYLVFYAIA
jgi:hypothetical protein